MSGALQLILADDYQDMSRRAAGLVGDILEPLAAPNVILPTGNTPLGMYRELAADVAAGALDLSRLRLFQLDEYAGIDSDDWRCLAAWLKRSFLEGLNIPAGAVTNFNPSAGDRVQEARRMERAIEAAGDIDFQLLGLGLNGHVGFNEPGSAPDAATRVVELSAESVRSNACYWGDASVVPRQAYTLGLKVLSQARRTLLLVGGSAKADILAAVLEGPITPRVPATFLRLLDGVTVIADRAAGCPPGVTQARP